MIKASLPYRSDIILIFVDLPPNAIASNLGRRQASRELRNTNLGGYAIAAAPDAALPMSHVGDHFNSGVQLIDFASPRELEGLCYEMKNAMI